MSALQRSADGDSSSSRGQPAEPGPVQSPEQQRAEAQRQAEVSERRRSVLMASAHAIASMDDVFLAPRGSEKVEWARVDVNLELRDGCRFHTALAASLLVASTSQYNVHGNCAHEFSSSLQTTIIDKLLEYAPTADSLQPSQPRDADELLQWLAIQLAARCSSWSNSFIQMLVTTLHERGFDLNRRSCDGRTLLTAYSSGIDFSKAIRVECLLLRLGADASKAASDGRSPILGWIDKNSVEMVESVLIGNSKMPFSGLHQRVDVWQRDADGRTLLECMQAKGAAFAPCATVLTELQQHWILQERPLVQSLLTLHTPLIPDLARLTVDYIDGGEEAK